MSSPPYFTYFGGGEHEIPKYARRVVIDATVQVIREKAFRGCIDLDSIVIPPSVKVIGANAFSGCKSLEWVVIPDSVEVVGDGAFYDCSCLEAIVIPERVKAIGMGAFYGCSRLASAEIPSSIRTIEPYLFHGCIALVTVTIPDSVTNIGRNAFFRCETLTSIVIPNSVTTIGDLAFSGCSNLELLVIPDSVVSTGWGAFSKCRSLESVFVPDGFATIVWGAFSDCSSLKSVVMPNSITTICAYAFHGCTSLNHIDIPLSVKNIDQHAFSGCAALDTVVLPQGINSIAPFTFYGCSSLKSILIPDTVQIIGAYAFHDCASLTQVSLPHSVTTIGRNSFYRCASLESVVIPCMVTAIRELAFSECTSLKSVVIPDSVNIIGESAFEGCLTLTSISIPESMTTISWGAFAECSSIPMVNIPASVATICEFAFAECTSLTAVMIPESVTNIGETAFDGCTSLALINIPASVKSIGHRPFDECPLLVQASARDQSDIVFWLRTRFDHYPAHKLCHRTDVTSLGIDLCHQNHPDSLTNRDCSGMSALHVLLLNIMVTAEMVEQLIECHPTAVQDVGPLGMYPLHLASINPSVPLPVLKCLSSSYSKDGRLVLTIKDESNRVPCALALRYIKSDETVLHLFERFPIQASSLTFAYEKDRLNRIREMYMNKLSRQTDASIKTLEPLQIHGWVAFVSSIDAASDVDRMCIRLINEMPGGVLRTLIHGKDLNGRSAIESANDNVRSAMQWRLSNLTRLNQVSGHTLFGFSTNGIMNAAERIKHVKGENECQNGFGDDVGRISVGEQRFRKLLKRIGINMKWGNDSSWKMGGDMYVELCKDVLDNVKTRDIVRKFVSQAGQVRRQADVGCNMKQDNGYLFGANYHFATYVGNIVTDALRTFRNDKERTDNTLRNGLIGRDIVLQNRRSAPIRLPELVRELTKAISIAHSTGVIDCDVPAEQLVRLGCKQALLCWNKDSENDCSANEGHARSDSDNQPVAVFFTVKTYLTEQVMFSEMGAPPVRREKKSKNVTNKAFRIINLFCPGIPKNSIPPTLLKKVENFYLKFNTNKSLDSALKRRSFKEREMRDFLNFLTEHDIYCTGSNLRRVSDKSSGKTVWVSSSFRKVKRSRRNVSEDQLEMHSLNDDTTLPSSPKQDQELSHSDTQSVQLFPYPPTFLKHAMHPEQRPRIELLCLLCCAFWTQQRPSCEAQLPFMNPLFKLPSIARQLWQGTMSEKVNSRIVIWHPPALPFLQPLFQLPSLQLRSWHDLFVQPSSQEQASLQPLVQLLNFVSQQQTDNSHECD